MFICDKSKEKQLNFCKLSSLIEEILPFQGENAYKTKPDDNFENHFTTKKEQTLCLFSIETLN